MRKITLKRPPHRDILYNFVVRCPCIKNTVEDQNLIKAENKTITKKKKKNKQATKNTGPLQRLLEGRKLCASSGP